MAVKHHPPKSEFRQKADQWFAENGKTKVYDKEDHQNFIRWYFARLHKVLSKSEMKVTRENFTYDLDYYMNLPNLSNNIEIQ